MNTTFTVASLADATAITLIQRLESNRLGFLPTAALHEYIRHGHCAVARHELAVIGYILARPSLRYDRAIRPITQLVTVQQFRRCGVATCLVAEWERLARHDGQRALQAWTRDDNCNAAALWKQLGFIAVATRTPTTADRVAATLWRKSLTAVPHAGFFTPPKVGGFRARYTTAVALPRPSTSSPHSRPPASA